MNSLNMHYFYIIPVVILLFGVILTGCDTDSVQPGTTGHLRLYIADAPGEFNAVNINITSVEVHRPGPDSWITLNDESQSFDLIQLSNGVMALLGEKELDAGKYTQIRLMLGDGNNIVVNGETHPLFIPSSYQSGYKLIKQFDIEPDYTYELLLDFDVHRSIHYSGGQYILNPTVRVEPLALTGAIEGYVFPGEAASVVSAIHAGPDTVVTTAYPDDSGYFKFIALPPDTYSIGVEANGYQDAMVDNVVVKTAETTVIDTVELIELE